MYGESFVTYCGFDDYVIDLENFPELQGKTGEEIAKWAYENSNKLSVDEDYDDNNRQSFEDTGRHLGWFNPKRW